MWAKYLLQKFRNTKHLQKINVDPIQSRAFRINEDYFADFLETLYEAPVEEVPRDWNYDLTNIPLFTAADLEKALTQLANLKCCDEEGIISEMLKYCNYDIKCEMLKHFNVALHSGEFPENWHHTIFQMLPKDGDTR